jgi:hypothetical protein
MDQIASESIYFNRRAAEERAAAERANHPRARQSHFDLAERYSDAARASEEPGADGQQAIEPSVAVPLLQPEFRILR